MNNKTEANIEMRSEHVPVEVEVKIPVRGLEDIIKCLEQCGFCPTGTWQGEKRKLYSIYTVKETPLKSIPSEGGFQWYFYSIISEIL